MKKNKYDLFLILKKLKKNKLLNNLSTLNNEKHRLEFVKKTINEMLNDNNKSNKTENYGSDLRVKAAFRANLMNKLEISNNRETHIQNEIKQNLAEIGKIEKQNEKIRSRKKIFQIKKDNLSELKKESYFKPKNTQYP